MAGGISGKFLSFFGVDSMLILGSNIEINLPVNRAVYVYFWAIPVNFGFDSKLISGVNYRGQIGQRSILW